MTRKRWADLRDRHLQTPEAQQAYDAARFRLADIRRRLARLREDVAQKLCDHCFAELHGDCVPGQECECECRLVEPPADKAEGSGQEGI